ncbi:MAG TPA: monofunctional biosynthetic peptidoglycan transglycosylase [Vicinamibacterales bacterium]|nr:monofunctional biosynthetic peptidoglycan transglycosylase [Vicinamibacterales bacterium]
MKRSKRGIWWRRLGWGALGIAGATLMTLGYMWLTLPDVRPLKTKPPESTAFMRLREAEAVAAGRKPRRVQRWIPYSRISPTLRRAVLVAEDAAFFDHEGIDYDELRASIEKNLAKGQIIRGGSTITQQLAKNLYLSPSRNPLRKIKELMIARRLEAELSKARILELYLNLIEWGDGIWGAEAAARTYFNTSASDLTADQAALLAGAIINPRIYSPGRPNARLLRRQKIILGRMGMVTPPPPTLPADEGVPSVTLPVAPPTVPPLPTGSGS